LQIEDIRKLRLRGDRDMQTCRMISTGHANWNKIVANPGREWARAKTRRVLINCVLVIGDVD
jgi:hypothetical protein